MFNTTAWCLKNKKTEYEIKINKDIRSDVTWTPIYFFPHIPLAGAISRFKIYQTAFTIIAVPFTVIMYNQGLAETSHVTLNVGLCTLACFSLYVVSGFIGKCIGTICIDDEKKFLQISHLTFWGKRNDFIVPIEDIVPLSDSGCNVNDAYVKLSRYSCQEVLYFTIKHGKILDSTKFEEVFGNLEIVGLKRKN